MGKVKSAVFIAFYTLLIAVLGFVCFVSFPYGENNLHKFNSVLSLTQKDADLGAAYGSGDDAYLGGGYVGVYYPEGVVSAKEYEENLAGYEALVASYTEQVAAETNAVKKAELEDRLEKATETFEDYKNNYVAYGNALYLFKGDDNADGIVGEDNLPSEEFKTSFDAALNTVVSRYAHLRQDGVRVDVQDEYSIRIFVPQEMDSEQTALVYLSYTGAFTVKYGSNADTAEQIMPVRSSDSITDYIKSVELGTRSNSSYVHIELTKEGKKILSEKTSGASSESSNTIYFNVGDQSVISLSVTDPLTNYFIDVSSSAYTREVALTVATLLDSALGGSESDIVFSLGGTYVLEGAYGNNALTYMYIAFGICAALMLVFFFVRYHLLGFVHLYTCLLFTIATVLCVWSIPFLTRSVETFTAFMLMLGVLSLSDAVTFEYARKEYELGKTIGSSVKTGYKKCTWHLFDLHIVLALIGFVGFGIAITNITSFLFTIGLLAVFSGLGSLAINRFTWATMMALAKNKRAFCNFKVEESDDE